MHVTMIMPAMGFKPGKPYVASWKMEPLGLATLAALTPPDIELSFFDDRMESISFDHQTDLVAINVETYTARRAFNIAKRFMDRGIPVVMGGYHATLMPEETAQHCDSVLIGEAEQVWGEILKDVSSGALVSRYQARGPTQIGTLLPRREIYTGKRYLPITLVETGRGCRFSCKFCSVSGFFDSSYKGRPIETIVEEIRQLKTRSVFLIDDNIVSDADRAKELFRALIPLRIRWISQGSITMADDDELLDLMRRSGCSGVLIGFESIRSDTLKRMGKRWNKGRSSYEQAIKKLYHYGIAIYATFMFGYDGEDKSVFEETLQFAMEQRFYLAAFNHLIPFPGTPLYTDLENDGRLIHSRWWLEPGVKFGDVVYNPTNFSPMELAQLCYDARRKFYTLSSTFQRATNWRANTSGFYQMAQYLWLNVFSERAVHQRQGLPIGTGID